MRKKIMLCILALICSVEVFGQTYLPFPAEIAGVEKLREWLGRNKTKYITYEQQILLDGGASIFAVFYGAGSGVPLVDTYIYGCTSASCSLVALRRGVYLREGRNLVVKIDKDKSELHLLSDEKAIYLRVPIPSSQ